MLAFQGVADSFFSHPDFLVREVEARWVQSQEGPQPPMRFRMNPPASIFRVDLAATARVFEQRYPTAEVERVERILPNRLRVILRSRRPVAQLNCSGIFYAVSEEGKVISRGAAAPHPDLPVLILEGVRGPARFGQDLGGAEFWRASDLLAAIRRDGGIAGQKVSKVQVKGPDLFLLLDSGLEIRFSSERMWAGWQRLGELIPQRPQVLAEARYIDLRFEDPVIAPKAQPKAKRGKGKR